MFFHLFSCTNPFINCDNIFIKSYANTHYLLLRPSLIDYSRSHHHHYYYWKREEEKGKGIEREREKARDRDTLIIFFCFSCSLT